MPLDAADAKKRYALKQSELEDLAIQVGWLGTRFAAHRKMLTAAQILHVLSSWVPYLPPKIYSGIADRVRRYLSSAEKTTPAN